MSSATQIQIEVPELHEGQQQIVDQAKRFNVLACGRRFGKTTLGINLALYVGVEGYPVGWFSPTYKMLSEVWREMKNMLQPITTRPVVQEHRLELLGGGVIDMWSLDQPDAVRGRKYKRVIVDEAAMVSDFQNAWQAVIRPTLTDYEGDAFWLSTPRGMNFFKQGFDWGQDELMPEWASWHMPTLANPYISSKDVESASLELPARVFNQEYLAEFLRDEGSVFRNISANMTAPETTPEKHKGHRTVAGVDWAQKYDFTCISVGCVTCKAELELDRFNKVEWAFQRGRLVTTCQKWGVVDILAEENSIGSPNIEALQREGLPVRAFQTTAASKPPLIQSLALSLEKMEFKFINSAVGVAELEAYESKVNANTGRVSYGAPDGMHDDTVIARALMREAAQGGHVLDFT